jgi:hypothetical protein
MEQAKGRACFNGHLPKDMYSNPTPQARKMLLSRDSDLETEVACHLCMNAAVMV